MLQPTIRSALQAVPTKWTIKNKKKPSQKFSNFLMGDTKEQKKFSIKSFGSEPELRPFLIAVLKLLVRFYFIFVLASHR
jgi:hypothetical protein